MGFEQLYLLVTSGEGSTLGYCTDCKDIFEGMEPDAEHYTCPMCGGSNTMGLETAILKEVIDFE